MNEVKAIYDNLFDFESKNRTRAYPIHKRLKFDSSNQDLLDWICSKVEFEKDQTILDAGCGTGYSLIKLAQEKGMGGMGISISKNEIQYAKELLRNSELENHISFEEISFDTPTSKKYDFVLAIESLKHSSNLESTLSNLNKSLEPGGLMIVADDFVTKSSAKVEKQKSLWHTPSFFSLQHFEQILNKNSQYELTHYDLTEKVLTRNTILLNLLIRIVQTAQILSKKEAFKVSLETYLGGLLLENLYKKGDISYAVIIAKKRKADDQI